MDLARALQPLVYVLAPVLVYQGKVLRRNIQQSCSGNAEPRRTSGRAMMSARRPALHRANGRDKPCSPTHDARPG
jgi:hypothetical protein